MGEWWYYKGVVARLTGSTDQEQWKEARRGLEEAERYLPDDARVLQLLGLAAWYLKDRRVAIIKNEQALCDQKIPDPLVAIHVMNNLAWCYCEEAHEGRKEHLDEAFELSESLPAYQRVFRWPDGGWLDTRGWACILMAEYLEGRGRKEEACETVVEAVTVLEEAAKLEPENKDIEKHLHDARQLAARLCAK